MYVLTSTESAVPIGIAVTTYEDYGIPKLKYSAIAPYYQKKAL